MPNFTDVRSIDTTRTYSTREAAEALKCSRGHLYREIEDGRLPAARLNDRGDYRITGAWLLRYLETLRKETAAELGQLRRNSR